MPNKVTIYHNPRCSKSRAAVEWLKNQQLDLTVIEYLKQPPDRETITTILTLLNMQAAQLIRRNDKLYKELKLDQGGHSDAELIALMADNPALIERPVVTTDTAAAIGRPLDNIIELIDEL